MIKSYDSQEISISNEKNNNNLTEFNMRNATGNEHKKCGYNGVSFVIKFAY